MGATGAGEVRVGEYSLIPCLSSYTAPPCIPRPLPAALTCKLQQGCCRVRSGRKHKDERRDRRRVGVAGMQVERGRLDIPSERAQARWVDERQQNAGLDPSCEPSTPSQANPASLSYQSFLPTHFLPRFCSTNSCTAGTTLSGRMHRTSSSFWNEVIEPNLPGRSTCRAKQGRGMRVCTQKRAAGVAC